MKHRTSRRQKVYNQQRPRKDRGAPNPLAVDPTQTTFLRQRFADELKRRFSRLRGQIIKLIDDEDAFGLRPPSSVPIITNFDPSQPRSTDGKWTSGVGGGSGRVSQVIERLKGVGAKVSHLEHVAKAYTADRIGEAVAKLPKRAQQVVEAAFFVGKVAGKTAFATWTVGQALAERVARERGLPEEQARRLRGVLASVDIAAMKPIQLGLGASGLGAVALPASFIPPATAGYLAYSTASNPLAAFRAAKGLITESLAGVRRRLTGNVDDPLFFRVVTNAAAENAQLIADHLATFAYTDWYIALLSAATDATGDVRSALEVAEEAYLKQSMEVTYPQEDDAEAVLGKVVANVFCPTGEGGGVDPTCSIGGKGKEEKKKFKDPTGYYPPRKVVPKVGYHITPIENLKSIAKEGLKPQVSTTGGGGSGKVDCCYFIDKPYDKGHEHAPERLNKLQIMLKADTSHARGALDDTEVREFTGYTGDPNKKIGTESAFLIGDAVPSDKLKVLTFQDGNRVWIPLKKFVESSDYTALVKEVKTKSIREAPSTMKIKLTAGGNKTADVHTTDLGGGWVGVEYRGKSLGGYQKQVLEKFNFLLAKKIKEVDKLTGNSLTLNNRWAGESDPEKVRQFQEWLRAELGDTILGAEDDELWRRYVEEGFRKGAGRAFDDVSLRRFGTGDGAFYRGSRDQFLRDSFARPETIDKVKLLAGRVFDDMEGVTGELATRMVRHLADGLVQGLNPREIARTLSNDVEQIGKTRAETIARTEIIRAHAEGQLTALEQLGVEEVGVAVEWSTAADGGVCPLCQPLEGIVLKITEARGMLPRHPRCRCAWIPANVGEEDADQKATRGRIAQAVRTSQRRGSKTDDWGPAKEISKQRPEPVGNEGGLREAWGLETIIPAERIQPRLAGIPLPLLDFFQQWLVANERVAGTFFARCRRGPQGWCLGEGEGGAEFASPEELAKVQALARKKAKAAPVPTEEQQQKAVEGIAAEGANVYRKRLVGNSTDRANRRQKLLTEFGDGKKCPCVYCGLKIGEGTLEQDKIYTTAQGGKYSLPNLVPACSSCNKHRGDIPWKKIQWK